MHNSARWRLTGLRPLVLLQSHREGLKRLGSTLEFQLVRLQYLLLLVADTQGGSYGPALEFAQQHFADFTAANMQQVGGQ